MSALIIHTESKQVLGAMTGEIPKEGSLIWLEDHSRMFLVGSVVHVVRIVKDANSPVPQMYPTKLTRVLVEDVEDDDGFRFLKKVLKGLDAEGY